jgi:hypothetical protein
MTSFNIQLKYYLLECLIFKKKFKILHSKKKYLSLFPGFVRVCSTRELDFYKFFYKLFCHFTLLKGFTRIDNYNKIDLISFFFNSIACVYFFTYYFSVKFKAKFLKYYIYDMVLS